MVLKGGIFTFPHSNVVLLGQLAVTLFLLWALKRLKVIYFADFDLDTAKKVSFLFLVVMTALVGADDCVFHREYMQWLGGDEVCYPAHVHV